jgi:LPS export ABC transporter protein LptC
MKRVPTVMWPLMGIVILLGIVVFIFKVPHPGVVSQTGSTLIPGESLKISDVKYEQDYENGQGWELIAKEAHYFDATQTVSLKDVLLKLGPLGENYYTIKGNKGDYCRKREEIVLKGNVVGTSATGYRIETTQLVYRQGDESVVTDKAIRLTGPFFKVKGDGACLDLKCNTFRVRQNVHTTIIGGDIFR